MDISDQIIRVLIASAVQIGIGAMVLFSVLWLANAIQGFTFRAMTSAIGLRPLVYSTGWIGTTVHEFSHLVVLLVFRIKVVAFKPFSPDFENEHLGYVISEPDPGNPFHWLGFFLAGIAPIFGGVSLILLSAYLLLPDLDRVVSETVIASIDKEIVSVHGHLLIVAEATYDGIRLLFDSSNLGRWQFWVFLYFASCVFCHFAPSRQDLHGIGRGLTVLMILVLVGNTAAACLWFDPVGYTLYWSRYLGVVLSLLGVAFGISLAHCFVTCVAAIPFRVFR